MEDSVAKKFEETSKVYEQGYLESEQICFLSIRELPNVTDGVDHAIIKNILSNGTVTIFGMIETEATSQTGSETQETFGSIKVEDKDVFFAIYDDPGASGYTCCGGIHLDYCYSLTDLISNGLSTSQMEKIVSQLTACNQSPKQYETERHKKYQEQLALEAMLKSDRKKAKVAERKATKKAAKEAAKEGLL